jgi:hypothetical protein
MISKKLGISGQQPIWILGWRIKSIHFQPGFLAVPLCSIFCLMKTSTLIIGLLVLSVIHSQAQNASDSASANQPTLPAATEYRVVDIGANHRVWQRETYEAGPNGQIMTHVHTYHELASGMNYKDTNGQWQESQELIEAFPNGAVARKGAYQVIFADNLNSAGSIDMQTTDGKRLRSNILGLIYVDTATGDAV